MDRWLCSECGSEAAVVKGDHHFTESGLTSITLKGAEFVTCDKCGNRELIIPHMNQLMRLIALALIWKPCRLKGEDVRYLRKYVGQSAADFANLLAVDPTTLSKWENDHDPVGSANDRLIRLVVLAMAGDKAQEIRQSFEKLVKEGFPDIDLSCDDKVTHIDSETLSYAYA